MSVCHILVCTGALLLLVAAICVLVAVGHQLLRITPFDSSTEETFATDDGSTPDFFHTLENEVVEHIAKPVEAAGHKVESAIETDVVDPVKHGWDSDERR